MHWHSLFIDINVIASALTVVCARADIARTNKKSRAFGTRPPEFKCKQFFLLPFVTSIRNEKCRIYHFHFIYIWQPMDINSLPFPLLPLWKLYFLCADNIAPLIANKIRIWWIDWFYCYDIYKNCRMELHSRRTPRCPYPAHLYGGTVRKSQQIEMVSGTGDICNI